MSFLENEKEIVRSNLSLPNTGRERERERERERGGGGERETDRQTDRQRQRHREKETERDSACYALINDIEMTSKIFI